MKKQECPEMIGSTEKRKYLFEINFEKYWFSIFIFSLQIPFYKQVSLTFSPIITKK